MESAILKTSSEVLPYVKRIVSIADQHKDELGFLPFVAYEELALRKQLWIATSSGGDEIVGYLAFGGSNSSARIFQLYVNPGARGRGVGAALLDSLKEHARSQHFQI